MPRLSFQNIFISLSLIILMASCASVKKTFKDPEVFLYKGQAHYINGTYFIDPYKHNGEFKLISELFKLDNAEKIEKVEFNFLDDKHLEITYFDGLKEYSKIIKGKMKNGAFRYVNKTLPIGIPFVLFAFQRKIHHIALGNDDNIIITEYEYVNSHFILSGMSEKRIVNKYYFDKRLN